MVYNKEVEVLDYGMGRCHHHSLLPILLAKREKRNSLIIPLKYPEQNKMKRKVVNSGFLRSVIWKLIFNRKTAFNHQLTADIRLESPTETRCISLPFNPPTIGNISFVIRCAARSRLQFRVEVIMTEKRVRPNWKFLVLVRIFSFLHWLS